MSHIFISYNKQDHKYASQLADDLIHRGFDVWIDDRIDYGDRWWRTIVKAIQDCSAFIVIMTPNSDQSKWVEREVLLADQLHKPPFPILLAGNAFPIYVNTQWVDLRNRQLPPDRYYQRLRQVITPKDSTGQYIATPPKPTHLKRRIKLNEAWAIIIAAIITGIFAIAAALIATNNGNNTHSSNDPTATNQMAAVFSATPEPTNTHTPYPSNTFISISTDTLTPFITATNTSIPFIDATITPIPLVTATDTPVPLAIPTTVSQTTGIFPTATEINFAGYWVSSNADWRPYTPYIQQFNGIDMVLVPAGCFMMGYNVGIVNDEQPVHQQCFDTPFWIDRTEVTRAQYNQCVAAGVCTAPASNTYSTRDEQPVNSVTWFEALDYCAWLDTRLPSEREWEYAARGPDNLVYPWGNDFVTSYVASADNSNETADVGSRPNGASWVGALDMSGNVEEWVSSLYRDYEYNAMDGREDMQNTTSARVLRGGSIQGAADHFFRAADRLREGPSVTFNIFGFRCARDYEPPQ